MIEKNKFINSKTLYHGKIISGSVLKVCFENNIPSESELSSGFILLNEHNDYVQASFKDYTHFRIDDETAVSFAKTAEDLVIPDPIPEPEPYVPTEEDLQEQADALFLSNKIQKVLFSKQALADYLECNPLVSTCHNSTPATYNVTSEKQALMAQNYLTYTIEKALNADMVLTWNASGETCQEWTEEEFLQLIMEVSAYVKPMVSQQQEYEVAINACTTQEELDAITILYGE